MELEEFGQLLKEVHQAFSTMVDFYRPGRTFNGDEDHVAITWDATSGALMKLESFAPSRLNGYEIPGGAAIVDSVLADGKWLIHHQGSEHRAEAQQRLRNIWDAADAVRIAKLRGKTEPGAAYTKWLDSPQMIELMRANSLHGTADRTINEYKRRWQAESQPGSNNRRFRFSIAVLTELGITIPAHLLA